MRDNYLPNVARRPDGYREGEYVHVRALKVYVAAAMEEKLTVRELKTILRECGHVPVCDWADADHGSIEDLTAPGVVKWAKLDLEQVRQSDVLVLIPPHQTKRGGAHTEFGVALALGKKLIVVGERKNVFHHLPEVVSVPTIYHVVAALEQFVTGEE